MPNKFWNFFIAPFLKMSSPVSVNAPVIQPVVEIPIAEVIIEDVPIADLPIAEVFSVEEPVLAPVDLPIVEEPVLAPVDLPIVEEPVLAPVDLSGVNVDIDIAGLDLSGADTD